jgi:hypothetical protein
MNLGILFMLGLGILFMLGILPFLINDRAQLLMEMILPLLLQLIQ